MPRNVKHGPRFKKGQVLAIQGEHSHCRFPTCTRYIFVDAITERNSTFFYQDASLTVTIGWREDLLRSLTDREAGCRRKK